MSPQELQADGIYLGVVKIPVMNYYSVQMQPVVLVDCLKALIQNILLSVFLEGFFWCSVLI